MTLQKDGNPLYGESNIESKEKITPPQSLSPDEEVYNKGNEWLEFLKDNDKSRGQKAVRSRRLNTRYVSRGQRGAVHGETDGPAGNVKSKAQRKVVKGGK